MLRPTVSENMALWVFVFSVLSLLCWWDFSIFVMVIMRVISMYHLHNSNHYCKSNKIWFISVQFSSVAQSCPTLCDPMNHSTPGLPVYHQLLEFTQTYVHRVGNAIQPSHPLSPASLPVPNPSQHQGVFQWVNSSHEVAKVLYGLY